MGMSHLTIINKHVYTASSLSHRLPGRTSAGPPFHCNTVSSVVSDEDRVCDCQLISGFVKILTNFPYVSNLRPEICVFSVMNILFPLMALYFLSRCVTSNLFLNNDSA